MHAQTSGSYDRSMDTTGTEIHGGCSNTNRWRVITQEEWDMANALAQERQRRARSLVVEHRSCYEVKFPEPERLSASGLPVAMDANFASPAEILKRAEKSNALQRHLSLTPSIEELWDMPVDWSECVETPLERECGVDEPTLTFHDLREREIDLRGGHIMFDHQPRPAAMARAKNKT